MEKFVNPATNVDPWKTATETLSQGRRRIVEAVRKWAIGQDNVALLRELCREQPEVLQVGRLSLPTERVDIAENPRKHLHELKKAVVNEFGRGDAAREALIVIARVIEAENQVHPLHLPIPMIPRKLRQQRNPFEDGDAVRAIRMMRVLQEIQNKWVEKRFKKSVPLGLITLSAIVEGGLLHRDMIWVLLQRLLEPVCPIEWWGETPPQGKSRPKDQFSRPFIDLSLGFRGTQDAELRRWFVDPQTSSLIARVCGAQNRSNQNEVWRVGGRLQESMGDSRTEALSFVWNEIRNELETQGFHQELLPKTLNAVLSVVRLARFTDNYPSLVVGYCSRRVVCHSVRHSALPRFLGKKLRRHLPESYDVKELTKSQWYCDLIENLRIADRQRCFTEIANLARATNIPISARRIMEFACFKLETTPTTGKALALSKVRNYTSLVANFLGAVLKNDDPVALPHSDLVSRYQKAINTAEEGLFENAMRRHLPRGLLEFHNFLVVRYGKPQLVSSVILGRNVVPKSAGRSDEMSRSPWYGNLRQSLKGNDRNESSTRLDELSRREDYWPARRIMEFASFKIKNGSAAGKPLRLSTVQSYSSLIARFFGGLLRGDDPVGLPHLELVSRYGEAIDAADQGRSARAIRRNVSRSLLEFHDFLVKRYQKPGVNAFDVFGIGQDLVQVDANVLTPDEYAEARKYVAECNRVREIREIALALLSLGYWLGLRRQEARGLRTIDVSELGIPMLLIRPWERRGLKTANSVRALPLHLLPEEELARLFAWKRKRQAHRDHGTEQALFGIPERNEELVTTAVFEIVQTAMAKATGDPAMRYHHLRHSCASWSFLRLCIADFRETPHLFPKLPKTTELLRDAPRFRSCIYGAFPVEGEEERYKPRTKDKYALQGPVRQHAFAVAELLGHADPGTTLEHYIHFLDCVVPLYRSSSEFFPQSRKSAFRASNLSRPAYDIEDLSAEVWRKLPCELKRLSPDSLGANEKSILSDEGRWIDRVWHMLHASITRGLSLDELAAEYQFPKNVVDPMLKRAGLLRNMAGLREGQHRHLMAEWTRDERDPNSMVRLPCPHRPDSDQAESTIARLEIEMHAAVVKDRGQARRALDYFVRHQQGRGPLYFEYPDQSKNAKDYLDFLKDIGIQRLTIKTKDGKRISKPSEIRLIAYDRESRRQWSKALPKLSRDDLWPTRARYKNSASSQLGILAHMGSAPGQPLVANDGFIFFMLMSWIAWPFLVETCNPRQ